MSINRHFALKSALRVVLIAGVLMGAPLLNSAAFAGVHVGFAFNVPLPAGVHVTFGNYAPYYVGRVFYQPLGVWRPVYSFPVATPYGAVYQPYIYDGGQFLCNDYIPGAAAGYGAFVIEGPGYYNPRWYRAYPSYGYPYVGGYGYRYYGAYRGHYGGYGGHHGGGHNGHHNHDGHHGNGHRH